MRCKGKVKTKIYIYIRAVWSGLGLYLWPVCSSIHQWFYKRETETLIKILVLLHNMADSYWISLWTVTLENIPFDMCAQRRLKSACASAQSDQNLCCPHEETLHPWLSRMRTTKIPIRLRECAGWSEASLGAHVRRYVFDVMAHIGFFTQVLNEESVNSLTFTPLPINDLYIVHQEKMEHL